MSQGFVMTGGASCLTCCAWTAPNPPPPTVLSAYCLLLRSRATSKTGGSSPNWCARRIRDGVRRSHQPDLPHTRAPQSTSATAQGLHAGRSLLPLWPSHVATDQGTPRRPHPRHQRVQGTRPWESLRVPHLWTMLQPGRRCTQGQSTTGATGTLAPVGGGVG